MGREKLTLGRFRSNSFLGPPICDQRTMRGGFWCYLNSLTSCAKSILSVSAAIWIPGSALGEPVA